MTGLATVETKVAGRCDKASTEMVLPDSIHNHSRKQRIVRAGDPFSELSPAVSVGRIGLQFEIG
jgi:hypothetical protein